MMNKRMQKIAGFSILLLLLVSFHPAFAQEVQVDSADPASASQGTLDLEVTIGGSGFDGTIDEVEFLLPCDVEPCTDTGGVVVKKFKLRGKNKIVATVDIAEDAVVAKFDIAVTTGGRGGKGTTFKGIELFDVQPKTIGNDGSPLTMICSLNETEDPAATVRNDGGVNSRLGGSLYFGGLDKVHCQSGGVVNPNLSGLRLSSMSGGNIRNAKRFIDLAFGACKDGSSCLPDEFLTASKDTVQLDVRPNPGEEGHDHIQLMEPGHYKMPLKIWPDGFRERYLIQMMDDEVMPNESHACRRDAEGFHPSDDINVYIWADGAFSNVKDGLPDGYTVSTGTIHSDEFSGNPPTVTAEDLTALACSNTASNGDPCPDGFSGSALCYVLGDVRVRFTLHMEYE